MTVYLDLSLCQGPRGLVQHLSSVWILVFSHVEYLAGPVRTILLADNCSLNWLVEKGIVLAHASVIPGCLTSLRMDLAAPSLCGRNSVSLSGISYLLSQKH